MPTSAVTLTSSSDVLGDSDPNVSLTVKMKPIFTVSKTGKGMIQLKIPYWYVVANKNNMMFNEQDRDSCTSEPVTGRKYASSRRGCKEFC